MRTGETFPASVLPLSKGNKMPMPTVYLVAFLIAMIPVLFSAVAQTLRRTVERGQPAEKWQSWAALYGDNVTLPGGLFAAVIALWGRSLSGRWFAVAIMSTLVFAVIARSLDLAGFTKSDDRDRLYSPTKLWHDMATWPVVGSLSIYLIGAAVFTNTFWGYVALAGGLSWVAFVGRDVAVGLAPSLMHPRVQDTRLALSSWPVRVALRIDGYLAVPLAKLGMLAS